MRHISDRAKQSKKLNILEEVELAIRMEVMVTNNIATNLNITNRACSKITEIILSKIELPLDNTPVVHLVNMPLCIMVRFYSICASTLEGLVERVVPIEPMVTCIEVKMKVGRNQEQTRAVTWL